MRVFVSIVCLPIVVLVSCVLSQNAINSFGAQNQMPQLLGQLVSILDRLTSLDQRLNVMDQRFDQRLTALEQRVDNRVNNLENNVSDLKDRVDTLINHSSSRTSTVMQDLRAVCAELSDVTESVTPSGNEVKTPSSTKQPEVPFRLTHVEKTERADFYRVKVRYEGSTKPTLLIGQTTLQQSKKGELGVVEFDIPKGVRDYDEYISFILPAQFVTIRLNLNENHTSMDIPRLRFEVQQGKDVQFRPGEKVKLDWTFDVEGDIGNVAEDEFENQIFIQSDTQDNVINRYHSFLRHVTDASVPVELEVTDSGGTKAHRFARFVLNSTIEDVEGVLNIIYGVNFKCSKNCVLSELRQAYSVKFYREDHDGPFPKDFIGFVHDNYLQKDLRTFCDVNYDHCFVYCTAMGDKMKSTEITKMKNADENQPTADISFISNDMGVSILYIANVSFSDAGDFRCTARSQSRDITQQQTLVVIQSLRIHKELSTVTKFENGSLLATCVVDGIPAPNITFEDYSDSNIPSDIPEPHVTYPSQSQTRSDLFVSDPDVASSIYGFYCYAWQESNSAFDEYYDYYFLDANPDDDV